jgi:acyl-CoA thioester hydrolase
MEIRVYYEDTDCGNVVYYANYLRYMERSRTEFLRERGVDLAAHHSAGLLFTVTEANVFYKAPARYNDLLSATSTVTEITPASILFSTLIARNGQLLVKGDVRLACITTNGRPTRVPEEIKKALSGGPQKQ